MAAVAAGAVGFADWKIRQTLRKSRLGKVAGAIKKRLQLAGWDKYIPGLGECDDLRHQKLTEELQQDFQHDFLSACEATSNRLLALKKRYPNQSLYPEEEFAETKMQFSKKQILISVLGCHGSGKSTLLNALLDCKLLPMSTANETAMKIHIQNHEAKESANKEACPKLIVTCDGWVTNEVKGAEEIHSELSRLNESVRDSEMFEMETSQYRILMSVPLLGNVLPEWNVSLVDTPGFGEDNAKVSRAADAAMSASSACVYITTSGSLGSKTDTDCFKELHRHGVIEDGRLVIVVTKFDENYTTTSGKVLDEGEAKKRVASSWLKATNHPIPLDKIIAVSGLWAHTAQELSKSDPDSRMHSRLKQNAVWYLSTYPDEACGEKEGFQHHSSEKISEKLKKASGILSLEASIRHMAMKCGDMWISKMHCDYTRFLTETRESLKKKLKEDMNHYTRKDEDHMAEMIHYSAITECHDSLRKRAADDKSSVYKAIEQAFDEDLQAEKPEVKGREVVDELLNLFREKCRRRIKDRNDSFGPEEFQQELQQFSEEVKQELESTFNGSCRFLNINRTLIDYVSMMVREIEGTKAIAEKLLSEIPHLPKFEESDATCDQPEELLASPNSTTNLEQLSITSAQADNSASTEDQQQIVPQSEPTAAKHTQTLDEAMKVRNLGQLKEVIDIPPVTLSYWEQFVDWFRHTFGTTTTKTGSQEAESGSCDSQQESDSSKTSESLGQKKKYRYASDMDVPIPELKKHIMTECDHYCRATKPYVVHYFLNQYHERTTENLSQFESEFGARIAKRLVQLQKMAVQLDRLHQEIRDLDVVVNHLERMIEHLGEKAETFLKEKDHTFT